LFYEVSFLKNYVYIWQAAEKLCCTEKNVTLRSSKGDKPFKQGAYFGVPVPGMKANDSNITSPSMTSKKNLITVSFSAPC